MTAWSPKLALKLLLRHRVHAAISLFGIALTLVVLVVASAILGAAIGSGGEQQDAHRTLVLGWVREISAEGSRSGQLGWGLLQRVVRDLPGADEVTVFTSAAGEDAWVGRRELQLQLRATDAAYWRVHGFRFVEGGPYADDDVDQARRVLVLSESAAHEAFGSPPFVGRELVLRRSTFRVVGVVRDPSSLRQFVAATAWMPLSHVRGAFDDGLHGGLTAEVVAARSSDRPRLRREIDARIAAVPVEPGKQLQAHPDTYEDDTARHAFPPREDGRAPTWGLRAVLIAAAAAFLTLPVLNLVSLSLGRIGERSIEVGVRKAFGATPARLVAQLVAENVVLVAVGAVVALVAAPLALHAVDATGLLPGSRLRLDLRVLGWGIAWALLFGVVSGAFPAWRMARWHPVEALRGRTA